MLYDHRKAHNWRYVDWLQLNVLFIFGFHNKIQEVKTIGRGYGKFDNLQSAILLFCRNLDRHRRQP